MSLDDKLDDKKHEHKETYYKIPKEVLAGQYFVSAFMPGFGSFLAGMVAAQLYSADIDLGYVAIPAGISLALISYSASKVYKGIRTLQKFR